MRKLLALALASALAGCGTATANQPPTSGSTGQPGSSSTGTTGVIGSGSDSGGTSGSASSSTSSTSSTSTSSTSTGGGGTTSTTGACVPLDQYVGVPGATTRCCSGHADINGYCDDPSAGSTGGSSTGTTGTSGTNGTVCGTSRCVVYAQTATALYQVDPVTLALGRLCTFSGLGGAEVYDLAVRSDGAIFALTPTALYQVNPTTCAGTHLANLQSTSQNFNGMAFTRTGELIAADLAGEVVSIDLSSGAVTTVGQFGGNRGCSGDSVTLSDGTIYATAIDLTGSNTDDELVSLDPSSGYASTFIGTISGHSQIYGLGFWAGTLYGFDSVGEVLQIDPATAGVHTLSIHLGSQWFGAATTPLAPINR